jgi:hypothetical protein
VRFGSGEASAQIFAGRVDNWTAPDKGKIRGTLTAYDDAKRLDDEGVSGTAGGDLAAWIEDQASDLSMVSSFQVISLGLPVTIPAGHTVTGFRSVLEAAQNMVSAYDQRYLFFSGLGDMVLFDPDYASGTTSQFSMDKVISFRAKNNTDKRYNQIAYSNYVGYAYDFVTYALTVNPEGDDTFTASSVSATPIISGTYNDAADQAIYGVLPLFGGVQNNICASDAELLAFATSVATESQRQRYQLSTRFNPFIEIGSRNTVQSIDGFVARLRHEIRAGSLWTTQMEFWAI